MDLQTILQICESENIQQLDELKDELYLYLHYIFHLIIDKEKIKLYHYIIRYIKSHFVNQLTKGELYDEYHHYIKEFGLYLLLQKRASDNEIYDYIEYHFNPPKYYQSFFETETIIKIFNLELPERLINILKNASMTIILDSYEYNRDNYEHRLNLYSKGFETKELWERLCDFPFTKYHWYLIMKIPHPDEILTVILETRHGYDQYLPLLSIGNIEFFNKILKPDTKLTLRYYSPSCRLGDYNFSFKLLNQVIEMKFDTEDALINNRIARGKIRSFQIYYFKDALNNSYESKNEKLIELNTNIIKKIFKKTEPEIDKYRHENKLKTDIEYFLQHPPEKFDEKIYCHYLYDADSVFNNLKKLLIHIEEKNQKTTIKYSSDVEQILALYHMMNTGYRTNLSCLTLTAINGDDLMTKKIHDYRIKIERYYVNKNINLKKQIKDLDILFPVLLNIIYNYASY